MIIRDRRHLSEDGFVLPIIAINKHSGKSEALPEIVSRGFVSFEDGNSDHVAGSAPGGACARLNRPPKKSAAIGASCRKKSAPTSSRFLNKQTSRRPLIMPVILEV